MSKLHLEHGEYQILGSMKLAWHFINIKMVITITLFIVLQFLIKIKSPALFTIKNKKWKYGVLLISLIYHDISPSKIEENDKYYYFWQQPIYVISKF